MSDDILTFTSNGAFKYGDGFPSRLLCRCCPCNILIIGVLSQAIG